MGMSSQEIKRLTELWRKAALNAGGGFQLSAETEQYRLRANGIGFHELDYDGLRTAAVELTKLLLLPGSNTITDQDHYLLWAWCAELLIGRNGPLSRLDREISVLAQTAARTALSSAVPPSREAFERARQAYLLLSNSAGQYLTSSQIVLSYLCFPLLEAIARRACSAFLDINGQVLQSFPRSSGGLYQVGKRCSNVGDVLRLLRDQVADSTLQADMNELLSHVAGIAGSIDGYETVFVWRNSSLHGEATHQAIGGTIFTLALLIALDDIKTNYVQLRDSAFMRVQCRIGMTGSMPQFLPMSFYPPI
jgi:hypothetical protein